MHTFEQFFPVIQKGIGGGTERVEVNQYYAQRSCGKVHVKHICEMKRKLLTKLVFETNLFQKTETLNHFT